MLRRFSTVYGASPSQLLVVSGAFALTAYAVLLLVPNPSATRMLVWFLAAVVLHDLVLFPVYAAADRLLRLGTGALRRGEDPGPVNYVRLPVLGSGLLLLVFLPGIIRQGEFTYHAATGQTQQPFLGRWLLLTAVMFAVSGLCYLIRTLRGRRAGTSRGGR
ncbi:hypothetical protein [Actinopolyspora erythraea]|uniref:hypothetical protein n=1 Tax=Actinopolyspora erythraea TaxID=414996 RepID=UPI0005B871C5|nr:hypothetical protein [Actinopolyspora erythraea]